MNDLGPSPYEVKQIGSRHFVLCVRNGVSTRLHGFPTRAEAIEEKHRLDERRAVLLGPMQRAIETTLNARTEATR